MKTIIVENEIAAQKLLIAILRQHVQEIEVVGTSTSIKEAIPLINRTCPDLVFMDIELDDGQSFDILDKIDCTVTKIIFTTAYDEYALKAFEYEALDYLLKPYTPSQVLKAVNKAKKIIKGEQVYDKLDQLLTDKTRTQKYLSISHDYGMKIINIDEIVRGEADKNYCTIFLKSGEKIVTSKPLSDLESRLNPNQFKRTHKSHLVNINFIKEISLKEGGVLILNDGAEVPLSRRKKTEVLAALKN